MNALANKTSSQAFFLRVLKVIIQLRDAALHAMKKSKFASEAVAKETKEASGQPNAASNAVAVSNAAAEAGEAGKAEAELSVETQKFLAFAETHRTVLNQILRQSTVHLADGPFSVLVDHTRVLDFDIKRR